MMGKTVEEGNDLDGGGRLPGTAGSREKRCVNQQRTAQLFKRSSHSGERFCHVFPAGMVTL